MSFLDAFAAAHNRGQELFNARDYEAAFEGMAPDVEWHMSPGLLDTGLVKGRDAVVRWFQATSDAGDWEVHAQEFQEVGPGRILVRQRGRSTGRTTRISGEREFFQIFTVGDDGLVHEVREFETREDALAAT